MKIAFHEFETGVPRVTLTSVEARIPASLRKQFIRMAMRSLARHEGRIHLHVHQHGPLHSCHAHFFTRDGSFYVTKQDADLRKAMWRAIHDAEHRVST